MTFEDAWKRVDNEIAQRSFVDDPKGLYAPIEYTLKSGGKRLRPALCLMACEALGGSVDEALMPALGLEIFHNFTLLHDDLMDKDEMRRGRPTVYKKWDENTAILSGDAMQILAYKYIANVSDKYLGAVLSVFSDTALKVCEGQQYDMDFEVRDDVSIEDYVAMIACKTAVLIEASLRIGAIIAGASKEQIDLFGKFGYNLGLAFQLQDDWLDTFGNLETFGKDIGSDIVNNKKTYLLITALQNAKEDDLQELQSMLNSNSITPAEKIERVKDLYVKTGADVQTKDRAEMLYEQAIGYLDLLTLPSKSDFIHLAHLMLKRDN